MANSDKNIVITPNVGSAVDDPKIAFTGANSSASSTINLRTYVNSNGTISFEGTAGQLFSITNDLSNTLFSVNDISGIPSIEAYANGLVTLAPISGNVAFNTNSLYVDGLNGRVGVKNSTPDASLTVTGTANISGNTAFGGSITTVTLSAGNTVVTGSANVQGKILVGDSINHSNLANIWVAGGVSGQTANRPVTLIDTVAGMKIVRAHNTNGALVELMQWSADLANSISYWQVIAEAGNFTIRDIVGGVANTRLFIANTGTLTVNTALFAGNTTVTGFANVSGDVTIGGNLTVTGTTTYINTTDLNIGDNEIVLNADLPAGTAPTQNSGFIINRGSSANASFFWDEVNDRWYTAANIHATGIIASVSASGSATVSTDAGGSLTIGRVDGTGSTPYIDFNSAATASDFDVRMMSTGGNGSPGFGLLTITSNGVIPASNTLGTNLGSTTNRWNLIANTIATSGAITSSGGVNPASNTIGTALGSATARWVINANTLNTTGAITSTGALTITSAAPQISIGNNTVNGHIIFPGTGGVGVPTVSARSQGTRIVIYGGVTSTSVDYAIGTEANHMWFSAPVTTQGFKWYANTTPLMIANSTGLDLQNRSLTGVNDLIFYDPGANEGISWLSSTNDWRIFISPDNLTNADGNLQFTANTGGVQTRKMTLNQSGLDLVNNNITNVVLKRYGEQSSAPAISAGALTLDVSNGSVFDVSLSESITSLTISGMFTSGVATNFTLIFTGDGTSRSVTWPASVRWAYGAPPALTSTLNKKDVFTFMTVDGGTTWLAVISGQNF